MSHPAASVKSIFSGKVNLDSGDDLDQLDFSSNNNFNGLELLDRNGSYDYDDDVSSRFSHDSNYSTGSKFAPGKAVDQADFTHNHHHNHQRRHLSSNVSSNSIGSDTNMVDDGTDLLRSPSQEFPPSSSEPDSRPVSRNSNMSCLSVTATKDGIEGKKFHRTGPSPYSSKIIANMMWNQQQQLLQQQQQQQSQNQFPAPLSPTKLAQVNNHTINSNFKAPDGSSTPTRPAQIVSNSDRNTSQASFRTTDAECDGEAGSSKETRATFFEKNFAHNADIPPPITLNEKINMLNTDNISEK